MAINPRRRQKQLVRKSAKQKARAAKSKRQMVLHSSLLFQIRMAARNPIHECLMHAAASAERLTVLLPRR